MHLAKVPMIFVRRIMFELRLTPDIPFHNRRFLTPVLCVSSLPTQPFLFSRRFQRFLGERTQVKKRARRTARSVRIRGLDDRRDVRMRGPAIDDEEAWDDQHSFFSILEAPNCHKKKNHTRARHRRTRVYTSSLIKSKFFSSLAKGDRRLLPLQRSLRRRPSNNFVTDSRAHLTRVQKRCAKHLELVYYSTRV